MRDVFIIASHILNGFNTISIFFVVYAFNRPRHSFPTRRSSDLGRAAATSRAAPRVSACARPRWGGSGPRPAAGRDRKSTRLNSSHMSISYAVFCLKKKMQEKVQYAEFVPTPEGSKSKAQIRMMF